VVDYANDTFRVRYDGNIRPLPLCYPVLEHRTWLEWCLRNPVNLHLKGTLQQYIDLGMQMLLMFETEMEALRLGYVVGPPIDVQVRS